MRSLNVKLLNVLTEVGKWQAWRVEMNLFTKNIGGFVDFGKQAEPKNPCVVNGVDVPTSQMDL